MRRRDDIRDSTGPDIEVDIAGLRRTAATLRDLAREFEDRNGTLQDLLDDPDLHEAMRHAERDWWDQRRRIHAFLTGVSDAVAHAADTYGQVDQDLASGLKTAHQDK